MRRVVLSMFVTLDGFISGPNGELDWMPGTPGRLDEEVDGYLFDMLDEMDMTSARRPSLRGPSC